MSKCGANASILRAYNETEIDEFLHVDDVSMDQIEATLLYSDE